MLPGAGPTIATFLSYSVEKRVSKHPEEFGKGAVAGVAGPESANKSASTGAFVPMLALGAGQALRAKVAPDDEAARPGLIHDVQRCAAARAPGLMESL